MTQISVPIQVLSGALEAQWVIGYRHRREIYLVVDGDYYPWGCLARLCHPRSV